MNDYQMMESMREMMEMMDSRYYGKYRGRVEDNKDTTLRGRLQVLVPAVMGAHPVWALPCVPYAGDGVGLFALPPIGAGVWVEFEAGDLSFPIWSGCFWGDGEIDARDADPNIKFFKTDKATIRIDDNTGEILIENTMGSSIRLTAQEIEIKSARISQKSGAKKTVLTQINFDVHDGAFTVT